MTEKIVSNECSDPTQALTVKLPCQMVERIERYAKKNETSVTGVLIEALDSFLRMQR
jgi:predicted transcriptional regulator